MLQYSDALELTRRNLEEAKIRDQFKNMYHGRCDELKKYNNNRTEAVPEIEAPVLQDPVQTADTAAVELPAVQGELQAATPVETETSLLSNITVDLDQMEKYIRYAKTAARVINMLADGALVVVRNMKGGSGISGGLESFISQKAPEGKVDVSGILKATEKFLTKVTV